MNNFKPSILTLSLIAAGLSFATVPGFAQAQDAQETVQSEIKTQKQKQDETEVIEVKGFRGKCDKITEYKTLFRYCC